MEFYIVTYRSDEGNSYTIRTYDGELADVLDDIRPYGTLVSVSRETC